MNDRVSELNGRTITILLYSVRNRKSYLIINLAIKFNKLNRAELNRTEVT